MSSADVPHPGARSGPIVVDGPLPVAALVGEATGRACLLPGRDLTVGRDPSCDVVIDGEGVSRVHAQLAWRDGHFEISDAGSSYGTTLNDRPLEPHAFTPVGPGDRLRFADASHVFHMLGASDQGPGLRLRDYLEMSRTLASLDPAEIVAHGLKMYRTVSGVERSYLVTTGPTSTIGHLLTPLSSVPLSKHLIRDAVRSRQKASYFVHRTSDEIKATKSVVSLGLRQIWVAPVLGADGVPLAVAYLDSTSGGSPFSPETEAALDTVTAHIGMALRNALLHAEVVDVNQNLEHKVAERTRELEVSRGQLVAQDRLATLGRLVAAIAHELNNPVGAIASFANTLRGLVDPLLSLRTDLLDLLPDPEDLARVERLCARVLAASQRVAPDSRARREAEASLLATLSSLGLRGVEGMSQRLARMGLSAEEVADAAPILARHGDSLAARIEPLHTLGRSVTTIGQCAGNVARIVEGLKTYAHLDRASAEVADIHTSLQATLSVLGAAIPAGIEVVTRFAPTAPFAHRPGEMTQVWTNLVDNAVRAMGASGTLTVVTEDAGDRVRVSVADTGPGVPPELRDRIFELDVTSRGPGAGLGLGLPICRTLVERNHGGRIGFASRPGCTEFTVELPKSGPLN